MNPAPRVIASPNHASGAVRAAPIAALIAALAAPLACPATAQIVRPWAPPGADSLASWAAEARVRFQTNVGDSVSGTNFRAYELVGMMGRRMLRALGRGHFAQAHAVEAVLDSLGLSCEVRVDPVLPDFVLLMVHNPYRPAAGAVGFLSWFRGADLRTQGVAFDGGWRPAFRVWWTGRAEYPYECGIVDHSRSGQGKLGMLLLRMSRDGTVWLTSQFHGGGSLLGDGEAAWTDINTDGVPELVVWAQAPSDSLFLECSSCPRLYDERTYTERMGGFDLHDSRLMPSPYAAFQLFIRLLHQGNRVAAARLLADPARLDEALALGWAAQRKSGTWKLEYGESVPWPRWLALRFLGAKDRPLYVVRFTMRDGRWIIEDWRRERAPAAEPPVVGPADSTRGTAHADSAAAGGR